MNRLQVELPAVQQRAAVLLSILTSLLGLLVVRLYFLQCRQGAFYRQKALRQHWKKVAIPARRGDIRDREGNLLATSIQGFSCYANPQKVRSPAVVARQLQPILAMDYQRLFKRLSNRTWGCHKRYFIWLKRKLRPEQTAAIRQLHLPGIGLKPELVRCYPQGPLACHVLGFTGVDGHGLEGIEAACDKELSGRSGVGWTLKDGRIRGHFIQTPHPSRLAPRDGADVYLTLDLMIQFITEQELERAVRRHTPRTATAIVVCVRTGEILAMASRPQFDPNYFGRFAQLTWRNRAICDAYEMGSTIKPLVAAAAYTEGCFGPGTRLFCENGRFRIPGRTLHDHHHYGWLSFEEVIIKSSNIGMAKMGLAMGANRLYRYLYALGLGRKTGIRLPGESAGLLKRPARWTAFTLTSIPMGHEITFTPLQLIQAYLALIGPGYRPHLLDRMILADGTLCQRPKSQPIRVYPEHVKATMRRILRSVVTSGTGRRANIKGVLVGGKTGTAQKLVHGHYSHSKYVSSFIGFAPIEKPELCALVSMNEPHHGYYGGTVAAGAVAKILKRALLHLKRLRASHG